MNKAARRVKGGIIIIGVFIAIYFVVEALRDKPPRDKPLSPSPVELELPVLKINYSKLGSPFIVMGPNPGGVHVRSGHHWYLYYVVVENNCKELMILDSSKFQLIVNNSQKYYPSNKVLKYQKDRLISTNLVPGKQIVGRLYFEVKGDGSSNEQVNQKMIYRGRMPCRPKYN